MDNLILKIKGLRQIRPEKEWILSTKAQILKGTDQERYALRLDWLTSRSFLIFPAILVILSLGLLLYNKNILYPTVVSSDLETLRMVSDNLKVVMVSLDQTTEILDKIEEPERALKVGEKISSTLKSGEKMVEASRRMVEAPRANKNSPETFSAISDAEYAVESVEYALQDMEETYLGKQKQLTLELIKDLENRSLNEEQARLLDEAKEHYNRGEFDQALEKACQSSDPNH